MPLSPDFDEARRVRESAHESIRPAGNGHGFHYVPDRRRGNLSPAGDDGETSSEEEQEDDQTPEPRMQAHAEYRRALLANQGRQIPRHVQEESDTETASDCDIEDDDEDEDEDALRRPVIQEPHTPRSRSRTAAYTPPRDNFTISEIRAHSRGREECDDEEYSSDEEDGLSVLHPSGFSEAASSPPRRSLMGMAAADSPVPYPSPPPTDHRQQDELADDLENLNCDYDRERKREMAEEEHMRWMRYKRRVARAKRMSAGSIKRSFTMSQGSDTDDEDVRTEAGYESNAGSLTGSAAGLRRLRRRTLEGNNRASLLFDDPPQRIVEQEEPETDVERHDTWSPPRRVPDVAMDELPFRYWNSRGDIDIEY